MNFRRSVIIALLWCRKSQNVEIIEKLFFFEKTTLYGKFFKILFRKFSSRHRSTLFCSNFVKFGRRESAKSCVIYLTKKNKNSSASQTIATARIASKICQRQPPAMSLKWSRFHPNPFTFGVVIAERVNTAKSPHKLNPIFGRSL